LTISEEIWEQIKNKSESHAYMSGVERTVARVASTGEVFTPIELVIKMLQEHEPELLAPGKKVLDPACGDGQFLIVAKWVKMLYFHMSEEDALSDLYGIDIMRDNVDICKKRLGGGTIIMGNALNPKVKLDGQTDSEYFILQEIMN
jgi:type I restriction-modification system DNA methylase subunit